MSIKDGRNCNSRNYTRRTKRAYNKCKKHLSCRERKTSIWSKQK